MNQAQAEQLLDEIIILEADLATLTRNVNDAQATETNFETRLNQAAVEKGNAQGLVTSTQAQINTKRNQLLNLVN
jgi:hypothetical protein